MVTNTMDAYDILKEAGLTSEHLELYLEQEQNKIEAKLGGENNE